MFPTNIRNKCRILLVTVAMIGVIVLVGCSSGTEEIAEESPATPTATAVKVSLTSESQVRSLVTDEELQNIFTWLEFEAPVFEDYIELNGANHNGHVGLTEYTGLVWESPEASAFIRVKEFESESAASEHISGHRARLIPGLSDTERISSFKDATAIRLGDVSYRAGEGTARAVIFQNGIYIVMIGTIGLDIDSSNDFAESLQPLAELAESRIQ